MNFKKSTFLEKGRAVALALFTLFSVAAASAQPQMAPSPDKPSSASGTFSPGFGLMFGGSVDDPGNGVDGNISTAANFVSGFGGSAFPTWTYTVNLDGTYAGDVYMYITTVGNLFSASALGNMSVTAYNGGSTVWTHSNIGSVFASWGINFGSGSEVTYHPTDTRPFNKLIFTFTPVASVSIFGGSSLKVNEVRRVPYQPVVEITPGNPNADGTIHLKAATTNERSNDIVYTWYKGGTASGTSIGTGTTLPNAEPGQRYTVKATVYPNATFSKSVRSATASYTASYPADVWYTFQNTFSQLYLGAKDGSTADNSTLAQYNDPFNHANQWKLLDNGGNYQIINRLSGKAIDLPNGNQTAGVNPIQYTPTSGANQQWSIVPVGDGTVKIVSTLSNKYLLDDANSSKAEDADVILYRPTGGTNQTWNLKPAPADQSLAVELGVLTGTVISSGVVLNWDTRTEINLLRFVIERSTDGTGFDAVDSIAATGNSTVLQSYRYTYTGAGNTKAYYRVRAVSQDGGSKFTNTVTVLENGSKTAVFVYPNPAVNTLHVLGVATGARYRIVDVNGKVVRKGTQIQNNRIDVLGLATGIYYLQIFKADGEATTVKFIKK